MRIHSEEDEYEQKPFMEIMSVVSCVNLALTLCTSSFFNPNPLLNKTLSFVMYHSRLFRTFMTFAVLNVIFLNYLYFSLGADHRQNALIRAIAVALTVLWIFVIVTGWGQNHYDASVAFTATAFLAYAAKLASSCQQLQSIASPYPVALLAACFLCLSVAILGAVYMALNPERSETLEYAIVEHGLLFAFAVGTACMQIQAFSSLEE